MKSLLNNLLRSFACISLAAILAISTVATVGCQKEAKKPTDPDKIEKARQQQMKMSQREMQNQG
ncbi:MAG: hypothetical protein U9N87_09400 [Planctomycetota bacterium]|nr:hypothetical protein [Planctomycetota bacterium]